MADQVGLQFLSFMYLSNYDLGFVLILLRECLLFCITLMFFYVHQSGRLRSGDHILIIGDTDLAGMSSEQVAQVLRQCGNRVKLVVARGPVVDSTSTVSASVQTPPPVPPLPHSLPQVSRFSH